MTSHDRQQQADRVTHVWVGIAVGVAICFMLSGCSSTTGVAFATVTHDPSSNFSDGIGIRVEAATTGKLRAVTRLASTNAIKGGGEDGYTYSGSGGARYGEQGYVEAGYVWFGYRSDFTDAEWASDDGTPYGRVGYDEKDWSVAATYYPVFGGKYETDELRLESRFAFGHLALFVEPSFYRMTLPVSQERVKDTALRGGVGLRW